MPDAEHDSLGRRVRRQRLWRQLALDDLAAQCGVSKSYLSRIENGHVTPAVATLSRLARALDVRVAVLLGEETADGPVYLPAAHINGRLQPSERGYQFLAMRTAAGAAAMQPFFFTARRGELVDDGLGLQHPGEEFVYIISGRLRFRVGTQVYDLNAGDALSFASDVAHAMEPLTESAHWLAVFVAPPTTRRSYRRQVPAAAAEPGARSRRAPSPHRPPPTALPAGIP